MSPTDGYVTKVFLDSEFQHKGNKQIKKKLEFSAKSWQEQIQKIKLLNYYTEKDKKYLDKLSSLRQEPTFKTVANKRCMIFFPF